MNINASIIDQRITKIIEQHSDWLPEGDINKQKSSAFVLLCMATVLDIELEETVELLTDGGNDADVDGLFIGEVDDGEFLVTIFQAKYKVKDLSGSANFPENAIEKAIGTIQVLFDPRRKVALNPKIAPKIEDIRSLIGDGYIPTVRVILCNNGTSWTNAAQQWLDEAAKSYGDKVHFSHFNHESIVSILQRSKSVDAQLVLNGKAIVEDMNFMRVLVGRVSVQEIQRIFNQHGDKLLERNIRRYLGLHSNRVNLAIHDTLTDSTKSDKFYFYNNGITVVCDKFDYNAFQKEDFQVQIKNMQVINGGQTCRTIQETLSDAKIPPESAYVMIRIYQLAETEKEFIRDITYATNSQNPVDLRDLHSNDTLQKQLETGIESLGYTYKRQREEGVGGSNVVTSSIVAESVLAIWRKKPHQAKFRRKEHFDKLYTEIFDNLNASQAVLAVIIFRTVETQRKKLTPENSTNFLLYASHYISMLIGSNLLLEHGIKFNEISHRNFQDLLSTFETRHDEFYRNAIEKIQSALVACYGERDISLQQLSATFRRGDLLEMLSL
jgi:hypothetical protein